MWLIVAALVLFAVAGVLLWISRPKGSPEQSPAQQVATDVSSERQLEVVEELEPELEGDTEPEPLPEPEMPAEAEPEPENVRETVPEPQPANEPVVEAEPKFPAVKLPKGLRRERKAWAADRGFSFSKTDAYLTDEWSRGAAASGAAPKDVVAGVVNVLGLDYEMYLVDLDATPVLAVRRSGASDVVVDARRVGELLDDDSDDLLPVTQVSGFAILSNDFGAAERAVDERVIAALAAMPEAVTAVWAESDWVLAQTHKNSHSEDWEGTIQPLALLADAFRVLPPRAVRNLDVVTKTRPVGDPVDVEKPAEPETVKIPRSEEPVDLPTRARHEARGVVEARPVGADEVDSIADGPAELPETDGTRVVRRADKPTIF